MKASPGCHPGEYTIAKLFSDTGYATALYGKWHLGDVQGRLPTDQGYDEWWGIKNSWDEAGYTAWPLFKESGFPVPMIDEYHALARPEGRTIDFGFSWTLCIPKPAPQPQAAKP